MKFQVNFQGGSCSELLVVRKICGTEFFPCVIEFSLSLRFRNTASAASPCVQCPDNRDWFLQQLSHLSKRIDHLHGEIQKCDCKKISYEGSQLQEAIHQALKLYDADKTGMADYALESAGGTRNQKFIHVRPLR